MNKANAWLVNDETNQSYQLNWEKTLIGRDIDSDIKVPDQQVSRHHALIRQHNYGVFILQVQEAQIPVLVNGHTISLPTQLAHGDMITIGKTPFRFVLG